MPSLEEIQKAAGSNIEPKAFTYVCNKISVIQFYHKIKNCHVSLPFTEIEQEMNISEYKNLILKPAYRALEEHYALHSI